MRRKLNWIDILVIAVLVLATVLLYLYKTKDDGGTDNFVTGKIPITYVAEAYNVLPSVCESIKVGDQLVSNDKYQQGTITAVEIIDTPLIQAVDGELVVFRQSLTKTLRVTIEGTANQYGPYIDLGGQEIKSGKNYWIKTDKMHAYGYVVLVKE